MRKIDLIIIHCSDTRTAAQKRTMLDLLRALRTDYPDAEVIGLRDLPRVKKVLPPLRRKGMDE